MFDVACLKSRVTLGLKSAIYMEIYFTAFKRIAGEEAVINREDEIETASGGRDVTR